MIWLLLVPYLLIGLCVGVQARLLSSGDIKRIYCILVGLSWPLWVTAFFLMMLVSWLGD